MLFLGTFAVACRFHSPRQGATRAIALAMFVTVIGVSNRQSYSFLSVADSMAMMMLLLALLSLTAWIPRSSQPQKVYRRLVERFFRSSEFLLTTMPWNLTHQPSRLQRWRRAFHLREVATLPAKLAAWGGVIDSRRMDTPAEQVHALGATLQVLSYRMQELLEAGEQPQSELLVRELPSDVCGWRLGVQETLHRLSSNPAHATATSFSDRLARLLVQLESRIRVTLDKTADGEASELHGENLFRLLGAYRGLSAALVDYAASADSIDWKRWQENRF